MTTVGVGCTERVDAGLSLHGVNVVDRCNSIGIIVDTSHCGHDTTLDACRVSRKPVTANHTARSEEHTSELQSLMRISYAVFCLKKKTQHKNKKLEKFYT